jgi:Flp pilus assembly protein TadD
VVPLAALVLGIWGPLAFWLLRGAGAPVMEDRLIFGPPAALTALAIVGWLAGPLAGLWPRRVSPLSAMAALLLGLGVALTAWQVRAWKNSIWLWEYTLLVTHDNVSAHISLGQAYRNSPHPERNALAREQYEAALALAPTEAKAHNNLALIDMDEWQLDSACEHLRVARTYDPTLAVIPLNWGTVLERQGRLDEAILQFRDGLGLKPDLTAAHGHLGRALAGLGRWEEAEAAFRRAVELDPKWLEFRADRAWALGHLGRREEAAQEYEAAMRGDDDWPETMRRSAWDWATDPRVKRRDGFEAVRRAEEACQARKEVDARCLNTLAAAYAAAGALDRAALVARQALELAGDDEELRAEIWEYLVAYLDRRPP